MYVNSNAQHISVSVLIFYFVTTVAYRQLTLHFRHINFVVCFLVKGTHDCEHGPETDQCLLCLLSFKEGHLIVWVLGLK
jgi:hypothetical protein